MSGLWAKIAGIFTGGDKTDRKPVNARTGEAGETAAAAHLRQAGLRVLASNWRNPDDVREEIDLVCQDGEVLVFVEVKTRAAGARVSGYHAVNKRKKAVLLRACRAYLGRLRPGARHYRFDIVEVAHGTPPQPRSPAAVTGPGAGLPAELHSMQGGLAVWHYRNVPLFPERSMHRHG